MTDEQIERLVSRFLAWNLPADFMPDGGISFNPPPSGLSFMWPTGTNLLTHEQAAAMVRHMLDEAVMIKCEGFVIVRDDGEPLINTFEMDEETCAWSLWFKHGISWDEAIEKSYRGRPATLIVHEEGDDA